MCRCKVKWPLALVLVLLLLQAPIAMAAGALSDAQADLLNGQVFTVGYSENHRPYQYTDENGNAAGASVEILNALAQEYNFSLDYQPFDTTATVVQDFDIIISILGDSTLLEDAYSTTREYYSAPMCLLLHSQNDTNGDSVLRLVSESSNIGLLSYMGFSEDALSDYMPNTTYTYFDNFDALLDAFSNESVDAVLCTNANSEYANAAFSSRAYNYATGLTLPLQFYVSNDLGLGTIGAFSTALTNLPATQVYQTLLEASVGYLPPFDFETYLNNHRFEIAIATGAVVTFAVGIIAFTQYRKRKTVTHLLHTDSLTGLLSFPYFVESVEARLPKLTPGNYEIVTLDLDLFKMINSYYGMERGTRVIQAIASSLTAACHGSDALITRKSADHFVIFKPILPSMEIHDIVNSRVLPAIRAELDEGYDLSLSVGICPITRLNDSFNDMVDFADMARHKGKAAHEITYVTFNDEMRQEFMDTKTVTFRMEQALKDKEFALVFQPTVDFETMRINGAEALARWFPKDSAPIYPSSFIPVMEQNGFIFKLDLYVFEEVCIFIKENAANMAVPRISVNLSAVTLSNDLIVGSLLEITKRHGVSPSAIAIEISESIIASHPSALHFRVKALKEQGFIVAMDNFGINLASLNRLDPNVDVLKLDRSFLSNSAQTSHGSMVVEEMIHLAQRLDMKVVCEGVESAQQAQWLRALKSDSAQGYYFSWPVDGKDFKTLLRESRTFKI